MKDRQQQRRGEKETWEKESKVRVQNSRRRAQHADIVVGRRIDAWLSESSLDTAAPGPGVFPGFLASASRPTDRTSGAAHMRARKGRSICAQSVAHAGAGCQSPSSSVLLLPAVALSLLPL